MLTLPWLFLCIFGVLYVMVLLPRVREGALVALCLGAFVALVFMSFAVAAITFTRDVLSGRWPE